MDDNSIAKCDKYNVCNLSGKYVILDFDNIAHWSIMTSEPDIVTPIALVSELERRNIAYVVFVSQSLIYKVSSNKLRVANIFSKFLREHSRKISITPHIENCQKMVHSIFLIKMAMNRENSVIVSNDSYSEWRDYPGVEDYLSGEGRLISGTHCDDKVILFNVSWLAPYVSVC